MTPEESGRKSVSGNFIRVARDRWTFEESQTGKPFVPIGCNYFDAHTGWPPQVWTRFDPSAVREHFRMMEDLGVNAIRVWLQWSSFMPVRGELSSKALDQCHEVLLLAKGSGIRVNLTGPEFWEGFPSWLSAETVKDYQHLMNPEYYEAHASFWEMFSAHFADEPVIYGFDLANEPFMPWDGTLVRTLWNQWLMDRYGSIDALKKNWRWQAPLEWGRIPPPPNRRLKGSKYLLDYQTFREEKALQWVRNSVEAIRRVDRHHLVTVGLHQSSFPCEEIIPSRYAAFAPRLLTRCLDYIALHWYPFGNPLTASLQPFDLPGNIERSLSIFLANCRYSHVETPLVMEECSYYGGGSPAFWGGVLPYRTEMEQDRFSRQLFTVSRGSLSGWLNWPLQDTEEATDTSAYGGFYTGTGVLKTWGSSFRTISSRLSGKRLRRRHARVTIPLSRSLLLTDAEYCDQILRRCYKLYVQGAIWDFKFSK